MAEMKDLPKRLYKYRRFCGRDLALLVSDDLYYADPSTFNDPLDSRPSLDNDLEVAELVKMLRHFVEQRTSDEMSAAVRAIKDLDPKIMERIGKLGRRRVEEILEGISYNATNPDYEDLANPHRFLLGHEIERELLQRYNKGIVSLAENATCPLMWSHYGDQHIGFCVGYSVPERAASAVHQVSYGGSRLVQASKVAAMLDGDEEAGRHVDEAVLLQKAESWSYEREWRLIGQRELQRSPLEMEEVIFGMRCKPPVQYAVVKALEDRRRPVKFFEIRETPGTFELKQVPLNVHELQAFYPERSLSVYEDFGILPPDSSNA